ncbi:hypothetical protein [Bordetella ansorpii]|uniref:hypothetical protein n=1 Tax=Bordetella ansorpii TaxID=288768 RepID=UPI00138FAA5E|nr:hypothetical protein [Bordetella ansorpii]
MLAVIPASVAPACGQSVWRAWAIRWGAIGSADILTHEGKASGFLKASSTSIALPADSEIYSFNWKSEENRIRHLEGHIKTDDAVFQEKRNRFLTRSQFNPLATRQRSA